MIIMVLIEMLCVIALVWISNSLLKSWRSTKTKEKTHKKVFSSLMDQPRNIARFVSIFPLVVLIITVSIISHGTGITIIIVIILLGVLGKKVQDIIKQHPSQENRNNKTKDSGIALGGKVESTNKSANVPAPTELSFLVEEIRKLRNSMELHGYSHTNTIANAVTELKEARPKIGLPLFIFVAVPLFFFVACPLLISIYATTDYRSHDRFNQQVLHCTQERFPSIATTLAARSKLLIKVMSEVQRTRLTREKIIKMLRNILKTESNSELAKAVEYIIKMMEASKVGSSRFMYSLGTDLFGCESSFGEAE